MRFQPLFLEHRNTWASQDEEILHSEHKWIEHLLFIRESNLSFNSTAEFDSIKSISSNVSIKQKLMKRNRTLPAKSVSLGGYIPSQQGYTTAFKD